MENRIRPGQRLAMLERSGIVVAVAGGQSPADMPGQTPRLTVVLDDDRMLEIGEWEVRDTLLWEMLPGIADDTTIADAVERGETFRGEQEAARRLNAARREQMLTACRCAPDWSHLEQAEPGRFGNAQLAARNIRRELVAQLGTVFVATVFKIEATDDQIRLEWLRGPSEREVSVIAERYRIPHTAVHDDPFHATVWNEVYGGVFAVHLQRLD